MRISINSLFTGVLLAVVMMLVMNNYPKILSGASKTSKILLPQANAAVDDSEDLYIEPPTKAPTKKIVSQPTKSAQALPPKIVKVVPQEEIIDYPVPKKYKKPIVTQNKITAKNTLSIVEK